MKKKIALMLALALIGFGFLSGCLEEDKSEGTTPTITWVTSQDSIVINNVTQGTSYNSGSTSNNIQFYDEYSGEYYYVDENLALTDSLTGLSTKIIEKDDEIKGFNKYHNYSLIWKPTNSKIGLIYFVNLGSPIVTFMQYAETAVNTTLSVTISNPSVPWSDIVCTLRDVDVGTEQSWQGISVDKDTGDGIIDYEVLDDGDGEVTVGDSVKLGYNTNLADNIVEGTYYSFSITYIRTGETIGSIGWDPTP
jgi:hypothetical protein